MLKKVQIICLAVMLSACASEPVEKGFTGTGDFDVVEAAKTRVSLGLTYLKNGNFSQAKFNLDKALEFSPRSGEAHYAMAFYYQQVGEDARAEEYYETALSYSRNDPDVLNSYGAFLCKKGEYDKAKKYFLDAVDDKSYISTASTYENLALCSQSQGNMREATQYFNSALNHQPTRASSLLALAQIYTDQGQWEDAKRSLFKYERNASVNAQSLWLSFQIAQGQNDMRAALEYADILKRLYPSNENTQKALAQLGKFQPGLAVTQKTPRVTVPTAAPVSEPTDKKARVIMPKEEEVETLTPTPQPVVANRPQAVSEQISSEIQTDAQALQNTALNAVQEDAEGLAEGFEGLQDEAQMLKERTQSNATEALANTNTTEQLAAETVTNESNAIDPVNSQTNDVSAQGNPLASMNASEATAALAKQILSGESPEKIAQSTAQVEQSSVVQNAQAEIERQDTTQESVVQASAEQVLPQNNSDTPFHIVKPKENLYRISLQYNVKVRKLIEWNNLDDASSIRIGSKLWVRDPNSNE